MAYVKVSSKVEEVVWDDLRRHAQDHQRNICGVLTEAISEYLHRARVRPAVLAALDGTLRDHRELLARLAP